MGKAHPLCPAWISPRPGIPTISWYDHASPGEGLAVEPQHLEYLGSFGLWPLAGTQSPVSGLTFLNHTWNVYSWYCHGLIAYHHFLLTQVLLGELLDLFPWHSVDSG
ncbi:unnamed protein product [Prunus armeniaca]